MKTTLHRVGLLATLPFLHACALAHQPPDSDPRHLRIEWRGSFELAKAEALKTRRPLLLVGSSGDITGHC